MDYEKKYKDALERARKFKNGEIERELEIGENIMEYVFPELKESEGERIRKGLIQYFKKFTLNTFAGLEPKKILSWLEKQNEQNSVWSEEDEMIALSIEQVMNCASLLNIVPEKIDKIRTWLKSLKDKYAWKPSDKQMEILSIYADQNNTHGSVLTSLYNDLKKL